MKVRCLSRSSDRIYIVPACRKRPFDGAYNDWTVCKCRPFGKEEIEFWFVFYRVNAPTRLA